MALTYFESYPEVSSTFTFEIDDVLFSAQSDFQKIEIVQSKAFGRILFIDEMVMLTERDEFVYHEMIAHVPLFTHPNPRKVLIIGGGDGGTARECLKHPSVEKIDLVDIDEMVTQACLRFMPQLASSVFSERMNCHFEDGVQFVKETKERYDVVIIDSTDPIAVGEGLFTRDFYQDCFNLLTDDGILVNQSESPAWLPSLVEGISAKLRSIFPAVHYFQAHIPTYPSGHWVFGFASKGPHPLKDFDSQRIKAANLSLNYYNEAVHSGAFQIPTFFSRLTGNG